MIKNQFVLHNVADAHVLFAHTGSCKITAEMVDCCVGQARWRGSAAHNVYTHVCFFRSCFGRVPPHHTHYGKRSVHGHIAGAMYTNHCQRVDHPLHSAAT